MFFYKRIRQLTKYVSMCFTHLYQVRNNVYSYTRKKTQLKLLNILIHNCKENMELTIRFRNI